MKMGRRLRCSSVTYRSRGSFLGPVRLGSRLAGGPFLIATPLHQSLTWCTRYDNIAIEAFDTIVSPTSGRFIVKLPPDLTITYWEKPFSKTICLA